MKKINPVGKSEFFYNDKWYLSDIGYLDEHISSNSKTINFSRLEDEWLIDRVKTFCIRKSTSVKSTSLLGYVTAINSYKNFIYNKGDFSSKKFLNKNNIQDYIYSLRGQSNQTCRKYYTGLKEFLYFLETIGEVDNSNKLIPNENYPRATSEMLPTPLDQKVVAQLHQACLDNDSLVKRFINIALEVGARANEILFLKRDCLIKSELGWSLRRYESKSNRYIVTPISDQCADVIQKQIHESNDIKWNSENLTLSPTQEKNIDYIFIAQYSWDFEPITIRAVNYALKRLIKEYEIVGSDGQLAKISTHKFRHTVATDLINKGVSQIHIQRYLGHKSAMMTNYYAKISDDQLRASLYFNDEKAIDINGNSYDKVEFSLNGDEDSEWLRRNLSAHLLPNGVCSIPIKQTCSHGNACLTCPSFRTNKKFKPVLVEQRDRLIQIIEIANDAGLNYQADINSKTLKSLNKVLDSI